MPRVTEQHRASRRDQITDAAIACFARKGFQRTSMADIMAASGLSAGAIYLHFDSKQQIAISVGRRVLERRIAELDQHTAAGAELGPAALLHLMVGGLAEDFTDTRILLQLWGEATVDAELQGVVGEIFVHLRAPFTRYLTAWARSHRGMTLTAAEAWAGRVLPALLALGQGFIVQKALLPGFDAERYFDAVSALLRNE